MLCTFGARGEIEELCGLVGISLSASAVGVCTEKGIIMQILLEILQGDAVINSRSSSMFV